MSTNSINRRNFIKSAVAGTAGVALLGAESTRPAYGSKEKTGKESKFIYRKLGNTGIELPIVSMGVMNADNPNLVRAALEAGIVHLDTAWYYQQGKNEEMIGEVVKDFPRDSYVIATKIGARKDRKTSMYPEGTGEDFFQEELETSLRRLQLDYVDILYLHNNRVKESVMYEPAMNVFEKAKKEGKTRFVGVTTHSNEPDIIRTAIESKFYEVVETAYNFKQPHRNEIKKAMAEASESGIGIVTMKNMAGAFWDRERTEPINVKAALKWVLQDPNVHTAIPGFSTFDQMETDLSVMEDLELTEQEIKDLRLNEEPEHGSLYCAGCQECLAQCPKGLPIPDLMRAYMYTYGYRNLEKAQHLVDSMDLQSNVCDDCITCSVECATGIQVAKRIKDVIRVKDIPNDFISC